MSENIKTTGYDYLILKFGNHRVLLLNRAGESATMSRPVDGEYLIFDFSACDVVGSIAVKNGEKEPTPEDILAETRRFQIECDGKIRNALLSTGAREAPEITIEVNRCPVHGAVDNDHRCLSWKAGMRPLTHDGPADGVKYLGMTTNGERYTPHER